MEKMESWKSWKSWKKLAGTPAREFVAEVEGGMSPLHVHGSRAAQPRHVPPSSRRRDHNVPAAVASGAGVTTPYVLQAAVTLVVTACDAERAGPRLGPGGARRVVGRPARPARESQHGAGACRLQGQCEREPSGGVQGC